MAGPRDTHGVTTYLQRQATRVKGDGGIGGGFKASVAEVDVVHEVLRPSGEELVRGREVPGDTADVSIAIGRGTSDGEPGCVAAGAMEDEVVE